MTDQFSKSLKGIERFSFSRLALVMRDENRMSYLYCQGKGEILWSRQDKLRRKHLTLMFFFSQGRKFRARRCLDTIVVWTVNNVELGFLIIILWLQKHYKRNPDYSNSGGSIFARTKLKRIDGRAPQGVESAAQFDPTRGNLPRQDVKRIDRLIDLSW